MYSRETLTRVLTALQTAASGLSSAQIAHRFGVANPRDVVYSLRNEGYRINLTESSTGKRKYVLASRKVKVA